MNIHTSLFSQCHNGPDRAVYRSASTLDEPEAHRAKTSAFIIEREAGIVRFENPETDTGVF